MINARQALYLARKHHEGQKRYHGGDYIWHVIAVAQHPGVIQAGEELYACALLHDIVEDTDVTLEQLAQFGASDWQLEVIENVTHRPNEPNTDYMDRVMSDPGSTMVKLADSLHNYDEIPMLGMLDGKNPNGEEWAETAERLRKKYRRNIKALEEALGVDVRQRLIK